MKARTIKGDIQFATFATELYPRAAMMEMITPVMITISTQGAPLGMVSFKAGIGKLNGMPTAVVETVIIEPAKKQNKTPLATL